MGKEEERGEDAREKCKGKGADTVNVAWVSSCASYTWRDEWCPFLRAHGERTYTER